MTRRKNGVFFIRLQIRSVSSVDCNICRQRSFVHSIVALCCCFRCHCRCYCCCRRLDLNSVYNQNLFETMRMNGWMNESMNEWNSNFTGTLSVNTVVLYWDSLQMIFHPITLFRCLLWFSVSHWNASKCLFIFISILSFRSLYFMKPRWHIERFPFSWYFSISPRFHKFAWNVSLYFLN